MKGAEPRARRGDPAGLSISQRRALVLCQRSGGLVLIERVWRASHAPGAEKTKHSTIEALVARGFLGRASETMVRLTEAGKAEAERSLVQARQAVERLASHRAGRKKPARGAYRSSYPAQKSRLPYADN